MFVTPRAGKVDDLRDGRAAASSANRPASPFAASPLSAASGGTGSQRSPHYRRRRRAVLSHAAQRPALFPLPKDLWFPPRSVQDLRQSDRKIPHLSWAGGSTRRSVSGAGFWLRWSGGLGEGDRVAEGFELADVVAGLAVLVGPAGVVAGAEVGVAGGGIGEVDPRARCRCCRRSVSRG